MKIFRIDRRLESWPVAAREALVDTEATPGSVLPVRLIADSAVVRNNRPVFVPDFAREGWVLDVRPAVVVGRLGKFISARFAGRYVSGIMLAGCLRQEEPGGPDALTDSFDGAVVTGITYGYDSSRVLEIDAVFRNGSMEMPVHKVIDCPALRIEDTIALLSRYSTLKSGDLILPASVGVTFPVKLNSSLEVSFCGSAGALSLRLK